MFLSAVKTNLAFNGPPVETFIKTLPRPRGAVKAGRGDMFTAVLVIVVRTGISSLSLDCQ